MILVFWILDIGFRILGFGYRILVLYLGFLILDLGAWVLDTGYRTFDIRCWILDLGCCILDFGFCVLDIGSWVLDLESWLSLITITCHRLVPHPLWTCLSSHAYPAISKQLGDELLTTLPASFFFSKWTRQLKVVPYHKQSPLGNTRWPSH